MGPFHGLRLSSRLLGIIHEYVSRNGTLLFIEFMFNTLALHHGLDVSTPRELSGIVHRREWKLEDLSVDGLYHPIKNLSEQVRFRSALREGQRGGGG
jgi:hypothetical protein